MSAHGRHLCDARVTRPPPLPHTSAPAHMNNMTPPPIPRTPPTMAWLTRPQCTRGYILEILHLQHYSSFIAMRKYPDENNAMSYIKDHWTNEYQNGPNQLYYDVQLISILSSHPCGGRGRSICREISLLILGQFTRRRVTALTHLRCGRSVPS